jgi:hypothetical protein
MINSSQYFKPVGLVDRFIIDRSRNRELSSGFRQRFNYHEVNRSVNRSPLNLDEIVAIKQYIKNYVNEQTLDMHVMDSDDFQYYKYKIDYMFMIDSRIDSESESDFDSD